MSIALEYDAGRRNRLRPGDLAPGPVTCVALGAVAVIIVGVATALGPLAGVAAVVAVAIGLATLANPALGALIVVTVVPITSGLARGLPFPGLRLSELAIGGLGTLVLLTRRRRSRVRWTSFEWLALAYVVATAVLGGFDLLSESGAFSSTAIGTLVGPLEYLLLYLVVAGAVNTDQLRRRALGLMLLGSIPVSLLAIMQQFDFPGVRTLVTTLTGTNLYEANAAGPIGVARATGPFPHWQTLGGYLAVIIVLSSAILFDRRIKVLRPAAVVGILILAVIAIIQTVTITVMLVSLIGTLLLAYWYGCLRRVVTYLVPVIIVAAVAFAPSLVSRYNSQYATPVGAHSSIVPSTVAYRYQVWTQQWLPLLDGRWITGFGPTVPSKVAWPYPESLYLELLLRGGLPLLLVMLALWVVWGIRAGPFARSDEPTPRVLGRVTVVLIVLMGVAQIIVAYFVDGGFPDVLWILAALLFGGTSASVSRGQLLRRRLTAADS